MKHIDAAGIAKILNKDFANNKDPEFKRLFACVDKENQDNLKIIDDWFVKVIEKQ